MTSKAKLKQYNLVKHAGKYFVDETSDIIKQLNSQGESALLGIQNKKGIYTIIGRNYVYYLTASGKKGKVPHKEFCDELHENGCRIGSGWWQFTFMFKNIILTNNDKVWLYNAETMFSLWSIMVWMKENKW
ncbi:hypothetical protein QNI16_32985 [Cytophagaceae bacterium YF14B1]|uniref:Uncharacterized protein n=1 Tax=Xanthocytophaga flava TaxID=3048013 RepID=A0AAE3U9Q5_9BACT|nr:hypothetical protein [Xanthocytophaga flavus]MDJ1485354.1 hypothetical protein [Xanthocytophaga flavus]